MNKLVLAMVLVAVPTASTARSDGGDDAALARQAERFLTVRNAFDQQAMAGMMAPDYREVSPIGEVDSREAVIGFYAPDKKVPAPPMTVTDTAAHAQAGLGTVTMRITYAMPGKDGEVQQRSMRAGFVARRAGREWQFVFAQLTPIRG